MCLESGSESALEWCCPRPRDFRGSCHRQCHRSRVELSLTCNPRGSNGMCFDGIGGTTVTYNITSFPYLPVQATITLKQVNVLLFCLRCYLRASTADIIVWWTSKPQNINAEVTCLEWSFPFTAFHFPVINILSHVYMCTPPLSKCFHLWYTIVFRCRHSQDFWV